MANININFDYSRLEFDKILNTLSEYSLSEKGRQFVLNIKPVCSYDDVVQMHKLLSQMTRFFIYEERPGISEFYNFDIQLKDSEKNIVIKEIPLYRLAFSVDLYFRIRSKFSNASEKYPDLPGLFSVNSLNSDFYKRVLKYIDPEGNIDSKISDELKNIRRRLSEMEGKIRKTANAFFNEVKKKNYTADDIISIREGFYCIAIKSTHKNKVDGIILDSSATGQTVFVTPRRVVELHNEYISLQDEEKKEIYRILKEFTTYVTDELELLKIIEDELIKFDIIYSKTVFCLTKEYNSPVISTKKRIQIFSGTHPLLGKNAVPLDISIGEDFKILVITGPNTGGKTVVLKTLGLFCLMVQSGLGIPASSSSQFCVFDKIYIDIGDDQSIEQSLSTFSAHITKIIKIVKESDDNTLILIDEFGAGTDPMEGSALAMSILNKIITLKSIALMTTHYSALKHFAAQNKYIENGSMEFDNVKLEPTYRLQIGIPGSSKAFEISKRLGMPVEIINNAISFIDKDYLNIEELTSKLEKERSKVESIKEELIIKERKMKHYEESMKLKENELEEKENELKALFRRKESEFLKESRRQFENIVRLIRTKEASKETIKVGKRFFDSIEDKIQKETKKEKTKISSKKIEFNRGDNVLVISKNIKGTIINKTNTEGEYLVQLGLIKTNVTADDLKPVKEKQEYDSSYSYNRPKSGFTMSLDLRGMRYEEAEKALDKFVEESISNNSANIRVIHGKGTGALRKCIQDYFETSPFIVEFDFEKNPESNSTNYGVTIAKLR